jgi:hypothetical protein
MVGPFPGVPYSFGALRQTYGPLFVRCDLRWVGTSLSTSAWQ